MDRASGAVPAASLYALLILTLTYAVAFVDRQVLVLAQESIKRELHLSDAQLGLLTGLAFSLFYVMIGIPVARFADRGTRRTVVAISLAAWSAMTALTGFATSYAHLFLARMGVGIGEAGCNPPSYSMIADLFPRERRAAALSFYTIGANLGVLIGFLLGGWLTQTYGWRTTFFVLGPPGILLAAILRWTVPEPKRAAIRQTSRQSFGADLRFLAAYPTLRRLAVAIALCALISYGSLSWTAPYLIRTFKMSVIDVGTVLALTVGIGGGIAATAFGLIADRLTRRDARWYLWLPALAYVALTPCFLLAYNTQGATAAIALLAIPLTLGTVFSGVSLTVVNSIAPPTMRATASALFLLVTNLFGVGFGSWLIGLLSDHFVASEGVQSLRTALLIVMPVACVLAILQLLFAARSLRADLDRAST
ncbi:spinster family MFS transporter [Sphingomonas sp.]|uniref:spinster family MFS transporter n=1 Tax=Sphingomonas sp. TaxID=28214 RepID=UPI003D6D73D5